VSLAAVAFLMTVAPALAHNSYSRNRGRQNRGGYAYGNQGRYRGMSPVDQVLGDLARLNIARVDHHERGHIRHAREKLLDFQEDARRGKFDRGDLDDAIEDLRDLAESDQFSPRDHQVLVRDLALLRDFRASGAPYRW
jgi:hypothetical protein